MGWTKTGTLLSNNIETNTAGWEAGGHGGTDYDQFGDYLSTFPRYALINGNFRSFGQLGSSDATPTMEVYVMYCRRGFTSSGCRYVTGATSSTSGNTVKAVLYTGTSLAAMTSRANSAAPFTTQATLVQVPWTAGHAIADNNWVAIVFLTTAINATTPPRIMTQGFGATAGPSFLNPTTGQRTQFNQVNLASGTIPATLDFTTSAWTLSTLPAWVAVY